MSNQIDLHPHQRELVALLADHKYTLAYGSSRGGKTFLFFFVMVIRALMYPGSTHCVIRETANSIPSTVWPTAKKVLEKLAPDFIDQVDENKSERRITIPTGKDAKGKPLPPSTIWFFGAQDDDATKKLMGGEYATILIDEIVDFDAKTFQKIRTRLNASDVNAHGRIELKFFATCNPKAKSHWVYQQWIEKVRPGTKTPLTQAKAYASFQFDATSNPDVDPDYYADMVDDSDEEKSSFMLGEWYDEIKGALFSKADLDNNRAVTPALAEFDRIWVAVDPSVSNTASSDEAGISVVGMIGTPDDPHFYPLDDLSGRMHVYEWAEAATKAREKYSAAGIVIETNQGGQHNLIALHTADPRVHVVTVNPGGGQGKNERAKPIASLMRAGRIHHPFDNAKFKVLEEQLLVMTGDYNRAKSKSPDRLDAYVYAISEMLTGKTYRPVVSSKLAGWFN